MLGWVSVLYLKMLPRAPLLLNYTMQDSTGEKEVAARGLFCSLWVGWLFGMYESWVRFCIQFAEASCSSPNQWRPLLAFTRETKELTRLCCCSATQHTFFSCCFVELKWRCRLKQPNLLWDLGFSSSFIIMWLNTGTVRDQQDHRARVRLICNLSEFVDRISFSGICNCKSP